MNHSLEVIKSVSINTSLEKLWKVMTEASYIAQYLHGTECITDWEVGSNIIFQGEYDGHQYKDKGIVQANDRLKKLSYLYFSNFSGLEDKPENYSQVNYLITKESDDKVKLTWHQKGYPNEARREHSESGMDDLLDQIKNIAEAL